ncbi:hypothetical protein FALBO_3788, partial [Fusarium albosuccineum]
VAMTVTTSDDTKNVVAAVVVVVTVAVITSVATVKSDATKTEVVTVVAITTEATSAATVKREGMVETVMAAVKTGTDMVLVVVPAALAALVATNATDMTVRVTVTLPELETQLPALELLDMAPNLPLVLRRATPTEAHPTATL